MPLERMWDKASHDKMAIDYGCWNVGRFHCNEFDFHRDCNYDRQNEAFSKMLYIPPIYPDGDYVLGFTWFGGGENFGHFGDYYDCSYIRIQGGDRLESSHVPTFHGGGGSKYNDACEATVDSLGVCWKEPCVPIRKTSKQVPKPFKNGKKPAPILSKWFQGNKNPHKSSVTIKRLHLIDTKSNTVLNNDLSEIIQLHRSDEISLLAETTGNVDYVQWYTNGKQRGRDYSPPFTIAGDFKGDFYPWMHPLFNRRIRVSVKAVAKDGSYCWNNVEIRFQEVSHQNNGVKSYGATSNQHFLINAKPAPRPMQQNNHQGGGAGTASSGGSSVGLRKRSAHGDITFSSAPADATEQLEDDNEESEQMVALGEFA